MRIVICRRLGDHPRFVLGALVGAAPWCARVSVADAPAILPDGARLSVTRW